MDPKLNLDGKIFHNACAKCADCSCQITVSNFAKSEIGDQITLLCKTHYFKRFHEGGAYLGGEKFEKKAPRDSLKDGVEAAAKSPLRTSVVEGSAAPAAWQAAISPSAERRPSSTAAAAPAAPAAAAAAAEPVAAKKGCSNAGCSCGADCTCGDSCQCGAAAETVTEKKGCSNSGCSCGADCTCGENCKCTVESCISNPPPVPADAPPSEEHVFNTETIAAATEEAAASDGETV